MQHQLSKDMECLTPYIVKDFEIPVPCGKCPNCLKRRVSGWSFRLKQQERTANSAFFITLTYDTTKVPITKNGFMELSVRDLQLFFKRLRKANSIDIETGLKDERGFRIKYYAVGEYGTGTMRPHYHLILFNARMDSIQPAWNNGQVHYGEVSGASIGYCLKYMNKPRKIPMHRNDDRRKEFSLMSKGLGANYCTQAMLEWHQSDLENRMYCTLEGGQKISMPRYYKNLLYSKEERDQIAFVQAVKASERMAEKQAAYKKEYGENWEEKFNVMVIEMYKQMFKDSEKERNKV